MGQKDISQKILEAYNDVFSDIVNVLLFHGKTVLHPDELEEQAPRAAYKMDGKYREIERDVAKRWKTGNIRVACLGLENQTRPDMDMTLRIIGYDGAEYRAQLNGDEQKGRYPVVTLVLYFGHKKHWDAPLSLCERLEIPLQFRPFVNDYRINLFEIAYLTREQVELFQSDFKIVADYFVQMRETGTYIGSHKEMTHIQETLGLLSVMAGDNRFERLCTDETEQRKGEPKTMCEVLDRIEAQGIEKGMEKGIEKGRIEAKRENARNLHEMGMNEAFIAKAVGVTVETVRKWLGEPLE